MNVLRLCECAKKIARRAATTILYFIFLYV